MYLKKIVRFIKNIMDMVRVYASTERKDIIPLWIQTQEESKFSYINKNFFPKIIWMYWDDEKDIPSIVKLCRDVIEKKCPEYEVRFLNSSSVVNYIDVPIVKLGLPTAVFADLIRLRLLKKYGGIWFDASIFLVQDIDWILSKIDRYDAFLFYSDQCTIDIQSPIPENWFIIAPIKSVFITDWLDEFEKCIFSNVPTSYYNDLKNDPAFIQGLTRPDYLLCYISAMVVLKNKKYNILYSSSGSTGHYFTYKYNFNGYKIACDMLFKNADRIERTTLIKFTSGTRRIVEFLLKNNIYSKRSLIGAAYHENKNDKLI